MHPWAFDDSFTERERIDDRAFIDDGAMHPCPDFIPCDIGHQGFFFPAAQEEAGMILLPGQQQHGDEQSRQETYERFLEHYPIVSD